jgi:4'-phosphopantetheinyl transferase
MEWHDAPPRAPAGDDEDVHLWWHPDPLMHPPRARRGRLDTLLRAVLARYVDAPPQALRFGREARGRPFLLGDAVPDFNLSDTGGGTLVAVARRARVGVDLERIDRSLPHARLARRYFAPHEVAALHALADDDARRAFLRLWTAKEASCKATGTGIYGQLDRWSFDVDVDGDVPRLRTAPDEAGDRSRWHHRRIAPDPDYTAVLACRDLRPQLRGFRVAPD